MVMSFRPPFSTTPDACIKGSQSRNTAARVPDALECWLGHLQWREGADTRRTVNSVGAQTQGEGWSCHFDRSSARLRTPASRAAKAGTLQHVSQTHWSVGWAIYNGGRAQTRGAL
eukprot:jgi/Botrbrau1/12720/Bobra.67_1s0083.1